MSWIILVDMDEVLADFAIPAARLHGVRWDPRPAGCWDMAQILEIPQDEFWRPINEAGAPFWTGLPPTPWAVDLHQLVAGLGCPWYVVSSPSLDPLCHAGKVEWLHRFFGAGFHDYVFTGHKHLLAGPRKVLIDDREETCIKFRQHGGYAVLFPSIGNRLHAQRADPLKYVETELRRITSY